MSSKFCWFFLFSAGVAALLLSHVQGGIVKKRFQKVDVKTFFSLCKISDNYRVYDSTSLTLTECAGRCLLSETCVSYCFSYERSMCAITSVFSAHWFSGIPPDATTETYDVCYSSWTSTDSIIRDTMITTSSPPYNYGRRSRFFVDGFFCQASGYEARRFDGAFGVYNYLQVDFGKNVQVAEIRVALRSEPVYFESVTVRLGTSSVETSNAVIAQLPTGVTPLGDLRIQLKPPVLGRYIHFKSGTTYYFSLGELQVIPEN
ncbi:uncharacterized protein LOC108667427 [Hyalella azteca]|uniref:Uncharacterized protein LOC108667427 n=1 Tax=Hyalella azteca TaxID=294128 RepID=A0A8B7N9C8_HYAAZ|nr:uncharacterized protein LOC108667427 [Hyalella azteca]